jgi:long-chain acyl-CoA synthetase
MVLPTSAEFVFVYHGVLSLGATAVTVNTLCTPRESQYYLADADCALAIGYHDTQDALLVAASALRRPSWILEPGSLAAVSPASDDEGALYLDVDEADAAVLLYTSGTTGNPKGAVLTHRNLLASSEALSKVQEIGPDDRMGTALPLFHVYGQVPVMGSVQHVGGSLSLLRRFDAAEMLELAAAHGLTAIAGVPTMWNEMLHAETPLTAMDLSRLRRCLSGGAPLPTAVSDAFRTRFGARILDGYGLTETTGSATSRSLAHEPKEGSVGRAVSGSRVAILDADHRPVPHGQVGEVAIDGPGVMREYWNRPNATANVRTGPWFLTGDLGRMDADGDLWIVGRLKELIIRGGYNVYPAEVEEILYSHPAILECAVLGISDERLGEEVAAVLVPHQGQSVDLAELLTWLGERLAAYKVPRIYQFRDALPKGTTGKILKRAIDHEDVLNNGLRPGRASSARKRVEA